MPIPKNRGKSAAVTANLNKPQNGASPLKIESVLPTLNRSPAKSIYRSYSTLSASNFKKPAANTVTTADSELGGRLQNAQPSPSGFWRIQRTAQEKLKLPDRINLDRRGLTAMPIIEDEPQLRLLSLQHNLINSFSVPEPVNRPLDGGIHDERAQSNTGDGDMGLRTNQQPQLNMNTINKSAKTQLLLVQRPSTRNLLAKSNGGGGPPLNLSANQRLVPNAGAKNSLIQKSVLLHAKQKYAFRKSSSFINSYSQHLAASKVHLGRLMDTSHKINSNMTSFSTDSGISDVESKTSPTAPPPPPAHNKTASPSPNKSQAHLSPPTTTQQSPSPPSVLHAEHPLDSLVIRNDVHLPANNLQNLVFIDLYDNQIEKISSLLGLKSLTVLLLGKNRINDISGLTTIRQTLRVLDLHGNKIASITNRICQLQELKSLNLAGNNLKLVNADDFKGLFNLRELNLKRNKIKRIHGFDDLRNLERLWLCHNDLQRVEDMSCIAKAVHLKEVTIENNPVSLGGDCVSFLVSYLPGLVLLSQMQVTEQVRRAAMAWRKSKETSDTNYSHLSCDVSQSQRREEIISNARTNWELLRSQHPQHFVAKRPAGRRSIRCTNPGPLGSDVEMELASDISNCSKTGDRKAAIVLARQKTITNRVRAIKRTTNGRSPHHKRSMSQENPTMETAEFFRLPPILAPFLSDGMQVAKESSPMSTSGSSLSPNIDSSSSCVSSDNEEAKDEVLPIPKDAEAEEELNEIFVAQIIDEVKEDIATTFVEPPKIPLTSKSNRIPTKTEDQINANISPSAAKSNESVSIKTIDISPERLSNISTSSAKSTATSPSDLPISQPDESTIKNTNKLKSATPCRRLVAPLARAQTARSININAQVNGIANNQTVHQPANKPSVPPKASTPTPTVNEREREQGGDYLIEICGRYLNVYGAGAIKFIDRQWNAQKAADVHTFKFSYVHFNSIATILSKIKVRFPNAENFVFRETNINCLGQLNALAEVQGIHSLVIDPEGNLVCRKADWRMYAIYRLSHWGVRVVNGEDVTEQEKADAQRMYSGLSDLVLWSLPDALLEPLLARLRLDESCLASKMTPKQWLMKGDESLRNVVGKEALQWKKATMMGIASASGGVPDEAKLRQQGKVYFRSLMENTCNAVEKLQKLETLWPSLLVELIRNTLLDYAQLDVYVRNMLAELAAPTKSNACGVGTG